MTIEEITQTLQRVAENQAKHAELHSRHIADISEIDKQIAAVIESQNRHDRQLQRLFDVMGDITDKQLKNEELFAENEKRFAELAESQRRLEGSYELLESFAKSVRQETHNYFAETDVKLAALASVQAETAELVSAFVKETNGRFAETDKRLAEFVSETNRRFSAIERNGKSTARAKKTTKRAKKTGTRGSTK